MLSRFPFVSRAAGAHPKSAISNRRYAIWNIVFSNILINRLENAARGGKRVMRVGNATECDAWRLEKIDKDIFRTMFQIAYRRLVIAEPEAPPRVLHLNVAR
jgi:hypothetical protein